MQVARRLLLTAIAAGALAAGATAPVSGQKPAAAPRTANGKVDFSGIWSPDRNFIYDLHDALEKGETLPLQPWAEKLARERLSKSDPEALCLPTGVPRQAPYPWRIVQTGTHMFFLFEEHPATARSSSTAGSIRDRIRPGAATRSLIGTSDTLGRGFGGIQRQILVRFRGTSHTEQLRGRTLSTAGLITSSTTTIEIGAYKRNFTLPRPLGLSAQRQLMEYICRENNKDVRHIVRQGSAQQVRETWLVPGARLPGHPITNPWSSWSQMSSVRCLAGVDAHRVTRDQGWTKDQEPRHQAPD